MKLTILGCHAATPRTISHTTSQVLETRGHCFLIDCGEGTQIELRRNKIKFNQIKNIFISHLHGDHYFGLIGLISTFRLLKREKPLNIFAPKGLKKIIDLHLKISNSKINFQLNIIELQSNISECIFDDSKISVYNIPLKHRIYTNGYLFKEKLFKRKVLIDKVTEKNIDIAYLNKLKSGFNVYNRNGTKILNSEVTVSGKKPKSYAFCSDTAYNESILPLIKNIDVLYHESTFLDSHENLCATTGHSTARQAATIASKATVGRLILGHFSSRYKNKNLFKLEAKTVFNNVDLAEDRKVFFL